MKQKSLIFILSSMLVFTLSGCSWFDRKDSSANNNNTTNNAVSYTHLDVYKRQKLRIIKHCDNLYYHP